MIKIRYESVLYCHIVSVCESNISFCLAVDWRVDGAVGSGPGGDGAGPARQGGGHQCPGDCQTGAQAIRQGVLHGKAFYEQIL